VRPDLEAQNRQVRGRPAFDVRVMRHATELPDLSILSISERAALGACYRLEAILCRVSAAHVEARPAGVSAEIWAEKWGSDAIVAELSAAHCDAWARRKTDRPGEAA
jgi:hypothetical protein